MSTVVVVLGVVAAILQLWVGVHALRRRSRPGAVPLGLLGIALAVSSLFPILDVVFDLNVSMSFGLVLGTLLWAGFALEYTGRGPAMTRVRLGGVVAFGVLVSIVQTLFLDAFPANSPYLLIVSVTNLTVLSLGMFGVFLVVRAGITYDDLPPVRALLVACIGTVLVGIWLVGAILGGQLGLTELVGPVIIGMVGVDGALCLLAQYRYDLLETEPSAGYLARDSVLDEMREAVLVTDREGRLLDSNQTASRAFGIDRTALGRPLSAAVGRSLTGQTEEPVTLETQGGRREYEVKTSPVREGANRTVGTVYLLRDVTNQQTHEQQLAVLNRVLRHNLRNSFDSIRGFAEPVRDGAVSPAVAADHGERIHQTARDISELSRKVSQAKTLLEWESLERESVDLGELVRSLADDLSESYPEAAVQVQETAEPVSLRTNQEILRALLEELADNGLKHDPSPDPSVSIELASFADRVDVTVRDNGPGIPEHEQDVLLEGEETPLRHGTGVGLWFVYWGVRRLGGQITFAKDPAGSAVTVTLPRVESADSGAGTGI